MPQVRRTKERGLLVALSAWHNKDSMAKKRKFVKLDYELLEAENWDELSNSAKITYIAIRKARYLRDRHGKVYNHSGQHIKFGFSDLKVKKISKSTYKRAVKELIQQGFIGVQKSGNFKTKSKPVYALIDDWKHGNAEGCWDNAPF